MNLYRLSTSFDGGEVTNTDFGVNSSLVAYINSEHLREAITNGAIESITITFTGEENPLVDYPDRVEITPATLEEFEAFEEERAEQISAMYGDLIHDLIGDGESVNLEA